MGLKIRPRQFGATFAKLIAVFALVLQPMYAVVAAQVVSAESGIVITNVTELRNAIENQADGQTWTIEPGTYGLAAFNDITVSGQTGWYFPVTANNLTINGVGNPTIYGTGFTANGNWATQNFVSVFGNNVTIDGLTLMPKVEPNKTVEVLGSDFTLRNTTITPNTLTDQSEYNGISDPQDRQDEKQWGGSLYFSHAGNHTVQNVTIKNSGVSFRYAPSGTNIAFTNVKLDYTTNVDWINGYRYSSGFNNAGNSITGAPSVVYHVNSTLNNLDTVLSKVQNGDTIELDSDLTVSHQATLTKAVTLNGNGHTLSPNFAKTDNDNNSALGIQASGVTVNNLVEDGTNGTNLHGINIFAASGVALNDVTVKNNDRTGVNVNGSTVTVNNITTSGNGWHGIDVDKAGAVLTVNGTSHHTEAVPQIYVDSTSVGQVVDTNHQYGTKDNVLQPGDRVYSLKPAVPIAVLFDANNAQVTNGSITTQNFTFHLSSSTDVTRYQLKYWNGISGSAFNGEGNAWAPTDISATGHMGTLGLYTDNFTQGEGIHYFAFSACNVSGVCSDFSAPFAVTYDKTAPAAPTNLGWKTSTNVTVPNGGATSVYDGTASWQDSASDVDHYIYKYWNDISGNQYKVGSEYAVATGATSLAGVFNQGEGVHHFCVEAVDAAGNTSACTEFTITYDTTAPGVPVLTFPANNALINTNDFWFDWNDVSGAASYEVQYSQSPAVDGNGVLQNIVWTGDYQHIQPTDSKAHSVGASGTWYWQVRAVDAAGNKSAWSPAWKVTIDTTTPSTPEIVNPLAGQYFNGASALNKWTAATDASGIKQYEIKYVLTTGTQYRYATTLSRTQTFSGSYQGPITISVRAQDNAGNWGTFGSEVTYYYDSVAPTVTYNTYTTNGAVITPDFTVSDGNAVTYSWSGANPHVTLSATNVLEPEFTVDADGTYLFDLTVTDAAGNATTKTFTFSYAAPVVPVVSVAPLSRTIAPTTNAAQANDGFSNVAVTDTSDNNGDVATTENNGGVKNASTQNDEKVLGATAAPEAKSGDATVLGLTWYWWVPITAAAGGFAWWFLAAWRRRQGQES